MSTYSILNGLLLPEFSSTSPIIESKTSIRPRFRQGSVAIKGNLALISTGSFDLQFTHCVRMRCSLMVANRRLAVDCHKLGTSQIESSGFLVYSNKISLRLHYCQARLGLSMKRWSSVYQGYVDR